MNHQLTNSFYETVDNIGFEPMDLFNKTLPPTGIILYYISKKSTGSLRRKCTKKFRYEK